MRSVNKVILIGNLTRMPELKTTANGQSIVTFGMATNRQWTTSTGEKRTSAEFHECVAWAKLAEICRDHLRKGMLVYVEGYLKTRSWDLEDGTRRFRTEIVLQDMIILEKRGDDDFQMPAGMDEVTRSTAGPAAKAPAPSPSASTPAPAPRAAAPVTTPKPAPAQAAAPTMQAATPAPRAAAPMTTPKPAPAPAVAPTPSSTGLSASIDDDNMF
jgi:single-strand DNA-binding protein